MDTVDTVVVGAGVVGLAVARALARAGHEVVVLEAASQIGTGISSRNSEVVHGGMYYQPGSLKARLCVEGNRALRRFAQDYGVPLKTTGKLIVATSAEEEPKLAAILARGLENGTEGLKSITSREACAMEPELACTTALWSPTTSIVDSHAYMMALLGDAEEHGAVVAFCSPVVGGELGKVEHVLDVGGAEPSRLQLRRLVIAAGLSSIRLARALKLPGVPNDYLCKGNYFTLNGRSPFSRLVYPIPEAAGLGVHYTLDLAGRGRFGPDVEWVDAARYDVDPARAASFYAAIRRYWSGLADHTLAPDYAGIRPKITAQGEPAADFVISGPQNHGAAGVVALYAIESPGLTASLPLAALVASLLD